VVNLSLEERNLFCANLLLWDRQEFHPYKIISDSKPSLLVNLYASKPREGFESKLRSIFYSTETVQNCFSEITFGYPDFREQESILNDNPNIGFVNSLETLPNGKHLLLNVACLAVRADWLESISNELNNSIAWIRSGVYEGVSELDNNYELALHTCGIYQISDSFSNYIKTVWKPIVKKYALLDKELSPKEMLCKAMNDTTFSALNVADYKKNFVSSAAFAHHDGPYENKHYDGVALRRLMRDSKIMIGISKHLFRELETIDINYSEYRKNVRQYFRAHNL